MCQCEEPHRRTKNYNALDKPSNIENLIDIKNFVFDSRLIMRACSKCHTVVADWETISESLDTTDEEKAKVKEMHTVMDMVLNKKDKKEE